MNIHSREILEFDQVLEAVRGYSLVDDEFAGLPHLPLITDEVELEHELELVTALRKSMVVSRPTALKIEPVEDDISAVRKDGVVLETERLSGITRLVSAYEAIRVWCASIFDDDRIDEASRNAVDEFSRTLPDASSIKKAILPYFDANGRFREDEIPGLREIIGKIQKLHGRIQETARGFLNADRDIWSSSESAQRDGRVVLALKSDYRGRVSGIVHGSSGSGQTLYIEPQELLAANNDLSEARSEYQLELHRILKLVSAIIREHVPDLFSIHQSFLRFSSLYARARYGDAIGAVAAGHSSDGAVMLHRARHPALGRKAVPISIEMRAGTRILVLSGPNTGGKTVSMKTLGLLALMNQSGMEIPAAETSVLPLFDDILVDIGDEQSIGAGLSTFSAHLKNISTVLREASSRTLVLLDELGSGTNPTEGSALSMAVLERLSERQSYAVITTHHDALKAYAYSSQQVDNASVEFDGESLKPTYSIIQGIPGESHALDIARRVGMDAEVLDRARSYIDSREFSMQQLIQELRDTSVALEEELRVQKERSETLESRLKAADEKEKDLAVRELAIREGKLLEEDRFLAEARKEAETLIRRLQSRRKSDPLSTDVVSGMRADFRKLQDNIDKQIAGNREDQEEAYQEKKYSSADRLRFEPGARVRYRGSAKTAEILEAGKKRNSWVIVAGSLKLTVSEKDLELVQAAPAAEKRVHVEYQKSKAGEGSAGEKTSGLTLDVRGMRLEEALDELQTYVDRVSVEGLGYFSVIHGKGTGVLQQGVHGKLKEDSRISSFQFAPPEDGGYGKTYVYLNA